MDAKGFWDAADDLDDFGWLSPSLPMDLRRIMASNLRDAAMAMTPPAPTLLSVKDDR